jgi:hypothetical protein
MNHILEEYAKIALVVVVLFLWPWVLILVPPAVRFFVKVYEAEEYFVAQEVKTILSG